MNLQEINILIEAVKEDKELFDFYTKKKAKLIQKINDNIKKSLSEI